MNKTFLIPLLLVLAAVAIVVGLMVAVPAPAPVAPAPAEAAAAPTPPPPSVVQLPEGVSPMEALAVVMEKAGPTEQDLAAALAEQADEETLDPVIRQNLAHIESQAHEYTFDSYALLSNYLLNGNDRVRRAAMDALRTGGDETAAPLVRQQAATASNPRQRAELEELAEYLELPAYVPPSVRKRQQGP